MIFLRIVGSAVIFWMISVQCTVEQSFFTKRFNVGGLYIDGAMADWNIYFANLAEHFYEVV